VSESDGPRRALLVDWTGVMTTSVFAAFASFCEREGLAPEALATTLRTNPECERLVVDLESGTIGDAEFEPRLAAIMSVEPDRLIDRLFAGYTDDAAMHAAVARARARGVPTGLISNSWGTHRYDRRLLGRLFDGVVLSGEAGVRKPDPRIYELGAAAVGVPPQRCVFVDDLRPNLPPAAELGMATIRHRDSDTTIPELEELLGVTLR